MGWMGTADTHLSHQRGKLAGIFQGVFLGEVFFKACSGCSGLFNTPFIFNCTIMSSQTGGRK